MRELRRECGQLGLDLGSFFETYDRWKTKILNYFDARQTSAAVEGINNKARVITKRTYGLKSAKSLWDRLILDFLIRFFVQARPRNARIFAASAGSRFRP